MINEYIMKYKYELYLNYSSKYHFINSKLANIWFKNYTCENSKFPLIKLKKLQVQ